MKHFLLILLVTFAYSSFAVDAKDLLGIKSVNLDSLNMEELVSSFSIVTNSPVICSAATYILYGSAKENSTLPEAKLFEYSDRKVSKSTLLKSKRFLMETSVFHTNKSTRAMAGMTIAFAFPNDNEIAQWLSENYFFSDISAEEKNSILGIIRAGKFDDSNTDLVVKAGLMSTSASQIGNAASCVKNNPQHYETMLPDLVSSLLTLDSRAKVVDDFDSDVGVGVSYLLLTQAIGEYPDSAQEYLGHLKRLSITSGNQSVKLLVMKMSANK